MASNHQLSALQTNAASLQPKDEVLEELYQERAEYAAKFQHNLRRMYQDLLELEERIILPRVEDSIHLAVISCINENA